MPRRPHDRGRLCRRSDRPRRNPRRRSLRRNDDRTLRGAGRPAIHRATRIPCRLARAGGARGTTLGVSITLSEAESRRVVSRYGVPVSPFVTGTSTAEVLAAVETDASVTFPVVAKLCGRAIAHKTERGLVRLRIADTDALAAACDELLSKAVPDDGEVEVLVSTMVDGNRELIAGLNDDPQFGMTVMVGIGGILAEAIRDVSFRLAPITEVDAAEMLDDLATQRLFGEFRGEPEADRAA
ncbi:MAG TPA: hypothetical protein DCM13_11130, partial [Acidimicrobiaceae bacterium]|nr:hypothetical protein [Acidimicrobiaceae bacterium]